MKNAYILIVGVLIAAAIGLNALTDRYKTYMPEAGIIFKTDTWTGSVYLHLLKQKEDGWIKISNCVVNKK
jgi:hypothetical protein